MTTQVEPVAGVQLSVDNDAAPPVRRARTRHTATRQPARSSGRVEAEGRGGEMLTRKRPGGGSSDPFHIPPEIVPRGWTYQWNTVSVLGNGDVVLSQSLQMQENGWRPVPAERHAGRYMPEGHKGAIIRDGLRLEERPAALTEEARQEDIDNARRLISDRNESLKLTGVKKSLGEGIEMGRRYRGTGGDVRMSIDPALDIPAPSHELAGPED